MISKRTEIKIANWYYNLGLTQEAIAKKLGYSRQRINKIIGSLTENGTVTIIINGLDSEFILLENKIEKAFHLKQVIIADTTSPDTPVLSKLGEKAARFLEDYIQDGDNIGVTWGNTLSETIRCMRSSSKTKCNVVQLVGGLNTPDQIIKPDEITRLLAGKLSCNYHLLYAPAIMSSEEARDIMAEQDFFKESFAMMHNSDIAVIGVGQLHDYSTIVRHGYLNEEDLAEMQKQDYVGDICFIHYKKNGDLGNYKKRFHVMGVDLETLREIPAVIAVAAGKDKAAAVYGALNTGCIDILITEVSLAEELERIMEQEQQERGIKAQALI